MSAVREEVATLSAGAICDFCSAHEVFQVYMAVNFTAVELTAPNGNPICLNSTGGWTACHECATLVDSEQWDELIERCLRTFKANLPPFVCLTVEDESEIKGILRGAHEQFRKLRKTAV